MQYGYARGSIINMNLNRDIEVPNISEIRSFVEDTPQLMENLSIRDNMNFFLSLWKEYRKTYKIKFEFFKMF